MKKIQKDELISLCRIKVNTMLSSLNNNNKNIFIPKYTFANKNESKNLCSVNNIIKKQKQKMNSTTIPINYNKKNKEEKNVDFIIDHGVLVYQKNLQGEEVINFGINKKKIFNKNILYNNIKTKTEINFNKKIKKKIKTNDTKNLKDYSLKDNINNKYILSSKAFYNKHNSEKENFLNFNERNFINITQQKSCNYFKTKTIKNNNSKIVNLVSKIKKIYNKKIKEFFEKVIIILDSEYLITNNKKSNSIYVNRRLTSNSNTSRSNSHFKNLYFLISKNFQFFSKNSKEKELYRDSKSLEKKYEQICKRKKLNMNMTFTDSFKKNLFFKESKINISERNDSNSFSNFKNNYYSLCPKINPIRNCKNIIQSSNIIYNTINQKINVKNQSLYSFRENSKIKIHLNENSNDNHKNKSYRIDKNYLTIKKDNSYNYITNNLARKKIKLYNINFSKNKINKKIKHYLSREKSPINKYYFHSVKNICTKDKRIYIRINYLPNIAQNNNEKKGLNISKAFEFNYIPERRNKERKKELNMRLDLIKEEEKIKIINSFKKNTNVQYFNKPMNKLINVLEKNIYIKKKEIFSKLNKLNKKQRRKQSKKNNFIIRDKIYMNNIFINTNNSLFRNSYSLDFGKNFNVIDSLSLK